MVTNQENSYQDERLQYHLQVQASQIQNVLNQNRQPATIIDGFASRRSFTFNLQGQLATGVEWLRKLKTDISKALGIEGLQFKNQNGQLQLQVLRPFEPPVPLLDLMAKIKDPGKLITILGFAEDGTAVNHDFTNPAAPNILITGEQNAGKTTLLRSMATSLAITNKQADVQFIIINPIVSSNRGQESQVDSLRPLNYIPHMLTDVVSRQSEISEILLFLVREMNYRSENLFTSPRIIVFIDQVETVLERGGRTTKEAVMRIAERGAISGINLVLATDKTAPGCFSPHLMTNMQSRIIGRSNQSGSVDEENPDMQSSSTLLGEGDFLIGSSGNQKRFQAAYIADYDLHMSLSRLYSKKPILLAQPISSRVQIDPLSNSEAKQFWVEEGIVTVV